MARAILKDLRSRRFIGSIYNPGCAARVFIFSLQYTAESVIRLLSFFSRPRALLCVMLRR